MQDKASTPSTELSAEEAAWLEVFKRLTAEQRLLLLAIADQLKIQESPERLS